MEVKGLLLTLPRTLLLLVIMLFSSLQAQQCDTVTSLGLADPKIIPNSKIVVSSEAEGHGKEQIRLDCCEGTYGSAWCPDPKDKQPFVEIHLDKPVSVGEIDIQAPTMSQTTSGYPENYMKTFDLVIKLAGINQLVRVAQDVSAISNGSVYLNRISLYPTIFTDVIRIEPKDSENWPCFRMELYQCETTSMCPRDFCQNNGTCSQPNTCNCPNAYYGEKCQYSKETIPLTVYKFLQIIGNTIITASHNLTFHGNVSLDNQNVLVVQPGGYVNLVDVSQSSCFSDPDKCTSGFTINLAFSISKLDTNSIVVLSNGGVDDPRIRGITLLFQQGLLHCYASTSEKLWTVMTQFTLAEATWYKMTISWSLNLGLIVLQGRKLLGSTFIPQALDTLASRTNLLTLGYSEETSSSVLLFKEISLVPLDWQEFQRADLDTGDEDRFIDRYWDLRDISQLVIESQNWYLNLIGKPAFGEAGVTLTRTDQFIEIPDIGSSCLTDPSLCTDGLTLKIDIKLATIEEDSVIFTTGGEYKNHPGVALLYRYGQFHAIVSTESFSWFVSVSRTTILTRDFCDIILSWSQNTSLKLIINQVLVGESASPISHTDTSLPYIDKLTIGLGITECVISELHIWHSYVELLSRLGLILCIPCSKPTTTSATTAQTQTSTLTHRTGKTTREATWFTDSSEHLSVTPTYYDEGEQCPDGCMPSEICFEIPECPIPEPTPSCDLTTQQSSPPATVEDTTTQQNTTLASTVTQSPPSTPTPSPPSTPTLSSLTTRASTTTSTTVVATKPPCPLPTACPNLTTNIPSLPSTAVTSSTNPQPQSTNGLLTTQPPSVSSTDKVTDTKAPQTTSSLSTAPQTNSPKTTAPETTVPRTTLTQTSVPQTTAPQTTAPQTTESQTITRDSTTQQPQSTLTTEKETTPKCTSSESCPTVATSTSSLSPATTVPEVTTPTKITPQTAAPQTTVQGTTALQTTLPQTTVQETTTAATTAPQTTASSSSTIRESTTQQPPSSSTTTENQTTPKCTSSESCPTSATSSTSVPPATTVTEVATPSTIAPQTTTAQTTVQETATAPVTTVHKTTPQITVEETTSPQTTVQLTTAQETTSPQTTLQETTVQETASAQTTASSTTNRDSTTEQPNSSSTTTEKQTTLKCTSTESCPILSTPSTSLPPATTVTDATTPTTLIPKTTPPQTTAPETTAPQTITRDSTTQQPQSSSTTEKETTPKCTSSESCPTSATSSSSLPPATTVTEVTTIITTTPQTTAPQTTVQETTAPQTPPPQTTVQEATSPHTTVQEATSAQTSASSSSSTIRDSTTQQPPSSSSTTEKETTPKCTSSESCPTSATSGTSLPPATTVIEVTTPTTTVPQTTAPQTTAPQTITRDSTTQQPQSSSTTENETTPKCTSSESCPTSATSSSSLPPATAVTEVTTINTTTPQTTAPQTTVQETTKAQTTAPQTTSPQTTAPGTPVQNTTASNTNAQETTAPQTTASSSSTIRDSTTEQLPSSSTTTEKHTTPKCTSSESCPTSATSSSSLPPETTVTDRTAPPITIGQTTTEHETTTSAWTTAPPTTDTDATTTQTTKQPTVTDSTTEQPSSSSPTSTLTDSTATEQSTTTKCTSSSSCPTSATSTQSSPSTSVTDTTPPPSSPTTATESTTQRPSTPTTTQATNTTRSTTTSTKPPCPQPPSSVTLIPEVSSSGQGQLICSVSAAPEPGIKIRFTWKIEGSNVEWSKEIEAPERSASISAAEINVQILNKAITCTAEVRYSTPNAEWCWPERSNVVVPSIKCPPVNGTIRVIEGREQQILQVQVTVPPSLLCRPEDGGQCRVEVLTTITTTSNELKCSAKEIIPQAVLGVSTIGQSGVPSCGVAITSANWQNAVTIPIKATIDGVKDGDRNRKLQISVRIIGQVTSATSVETCGEIEVIVIDRDYGATCSSVNDPHIKSYDSVRYNNFLTGEFVLANHKYLQYEVRALYSPCNPKQPKGATCNCGAAVRSGDDVITFDTCNTRLNQITTGGASVITVDMYKNGELTPGTTVIRYGCGQKYEVILPTRTKVVITSSVKPFLNINLQASSYDFESTEGLCGDFNNNPSDDLGVASIKNPDAFNKQWLRNVTIFKGVPAFTTPARPTFCSCQSGQQPVCKQGLDVYICNAGVTAASDITAALVSQAKTPVFFNQVKSSLNPVQTRGRRAADTTDLQNSAASTAETGFTEETSLQYCQEYLENSTAVQHCLSHLRYDAVNESIRNCVEDLTAQNDTQWAISHVDDLILECLADVQANVSTWENNENENGPNVPQYINSYLCTQNCGEHGSCVNSICECNVGWTGETCQIGSTTTPTVLSAIGACDLMTSSCNRILVEGNNFVSTDNLTCRIRYITVGDKVSVTAEEYTVQAVFISMIQVVCPENIASSLQSRSALVTLSNNGVTFSETNHIHIVEKSTCQTCTLSEDVNAVSCTWKPGSCVIDNQCFARYEPFGANACYRCDPDVSLNKWTKISDPNCTISQPEVGESVAEPTDNTAVIALGVVCGVLVLVAVGVIIVVVVRSRRRSSKLQRLWEGDPSFDIYHRRAIPSSADVSGQSDAARINAFYNPALSS